MDRLPQLNPMTNREYVHMSMSQKIYQKADTQTSHMQHAQLFITTFTV